MENSLDINFLGPPEVLVGGQPMKFSTRKAMALFAFLVVEAGTHPREKLQAIFWPESQTHLAQSALRNTLSRIKGSLRGLAAPLRIDAGGVRFDHSSAYSLDLDLVTRAAADIQPARINPSGLDLMQRAVETVRGPFLEAFSLPDAPAFNDWIIIQRLAWVDRLSLIHDFLSIQQLETHLIQPAIRTVNRWLDVNRLNEIAYRRLMRLHFLKGDRSAALQAYETCRDVLAQELGLEPSEDTEKVLAYIRSASLPLPASVTPVKAAPTLDIPFVGRSNEYQSLAQAFRQTKAENPQVAVVSGESGIGKTRLADEFLSWAETENADVLRGRAYESGGRLPYQPIIDALRERLERENAPDDLLDDAWLVELTRFLPELRERYPDLPLHSSDESTARARLFEAIARLGVSLAARKPLILLVDDLQWADPSTLEILHYLARTWRASRTPILLLVLLQEEAVRHGTGLRDWIASLRRDLSVTRIALSAMQASEMDELVQALAGGNAAGSADLSDWLDAETNGQPLFIVETLNALEEFGALVWVGGDPIAPILEPLATLSNLKGMDPRSLKTSIHDVILSRLEWLSQPAAALLAAAAVIGRNCSFIRLCRVAGMDEQHGLDALDQLMSARLITEARSETRPYVISHDRIRETVYDQISAARLQIFHRRALAALAEAKAPAADLAHHALAARDWHSAFDHCLQAGEEAMRLYEVTLAAGHFETARLLLRESKVEVEISTFQQLYSRLGQAYELHFYHQQALTVYQEMLDEAADRENREMELAGLVACCGVLSLPFDAHDTDRARKLANRALPLARDLGDRRAEAQIELSLALTYIHGDGQIQPAISHCETSAALARAADLPEQLGMALVNLTSLHMSLGQLKQAESRQKEALELFRELDDRPKLQDVLRSQGMIRMGMGNLDAALAVLDQAYLANAALGGCTEIYSLAITRNTIHIIRGEYDRLLEDLLPVIEMDEAMISFLIKVDMHQQLAWCYYDLGAYQESMIHCRKAISDHDRIAPLGRVPAFNIWALTQIARGELAEAAQTIAIGLENFDLQRMAYPWWWETLPFQMAQAELALAQNDLTRARYSIEQLLGKYEELKFRHLKPGVLYLQARLALAEGDKETANRLLSTALALSDEMGAHREVWAMCWALSELEMERKNESASAQLRDRARTEVELIAEHAGSPELRDIFLARPDVIQIMEPDSKTSWRS